MVGFRGVPTRLEIMLEKPLFFFKNLLSLPDSSLYLCRGLRMPLGSPRDAVRSSMRRPVAAKDCDSRTAGLANPGLCECDGGRDSVGGVGCEGCCGTCGEGCWLGGGCWKSAP